MYNRVIVEPPVEPLTLAEVKLFRAIDHSLHDDLLSGLIAGARQYVENECHISLVTQTREQGFDAFATGMEIIFGPVQELVSVEYTGTDGVATALTAYTWDNYAGRLAPAYAGTWPTLQTNFNSVRVTYVAGYAPLPGSPTDYTGNVPRAIKTAMQLLIGNWYENREASVTGTIVQPLDFAVDALLMQYRRRKSMA